MNYYTTYDFLKSDILCNTNVIFPNKDISTSHKYDVTTLRDTFSNS